MKVVLIIHSSQESPCTPLNTRDELPSSSFCAVTLRYGCFCSPVPRLPYQKHAEVAAMKQEESSEEEDEEEESAASNEDDGSGEGESEEESSDEEGEEEEEQEEEKTKVRCPEGQLLLNYTARKGAEV